jgi:hypothetical protein
MLTIERINREKYMTCNKVANLNEVKHILYKNTIENGIDMSLEYFIKSNISSLLHEKYSYYLHTLIIFKGVVEVHKFLESHLRKHGKYATEMLVNYPFISNLDKNVITPLMCAMLWCPDVTMVRTLYYWGADVSIQDVNGKYPEEKYGSHYVNHLNSLIAPDFYILGIRTLKIFIPVIEELKIISGENPPPTNWKNPGRAY